MSGPFLLSGRGSDPANAKKGKGRLRERPLSLLLQGALGRETL
jgi:hypothetical protein